MSSYLEGYGEQEKRRGKIIKWSILSVLLAVVLGTAGYFSFRDYFQRRAVNTFLERLSAQDYKGAYASWGCTDATPCTNYPYEEFLEDWGPKGVYSNPGQARVSGSKSCEAGVISFVRFPSQPDVLLWVDRQAAVLSFAPWKVKSIPPGFKHRLQEWMWEITRNCKPLIQP